MKTENERVISGLLEIVGEAKRMGAYPIANLAFAAALEMTLLDQGASVYIETQDDEGECPPEVYYDLVHVATEEHDECIPVPLLTFNYALAAYKAAASRDGGFAERRRHDRETVEASGDVRVNLLARLGELLRVLDEEDAQWNWRFVLAPDDKVETLVSEMEAVLIANESASFAERMRYYRDRLGPCPRG